MSNARWLVCSAALLFGAALPLAPVPVFSAFVAVALVVSKRVGVFWVLCSGLLLVAGAERSKHALSSFEAERVRARDGLALFRRCAGAGEVRSSPALSHGALRTRVAFQSLDCEGKKLTGPLAVRLYGGPSKLTRGDRIEVLAQLAPVRPFRNIGVDNPLPSLVREGAVLSGAALHVFVVRPGTGYRALIDRMRASVRSRIEATFASEARPMARALVLGENDLQPDDDEAFRQSGLAHLLAVSGTHLVFAVVALVQAVRAVLLRIQAISVRIDVTRPASALGVALSLVYAEFSGGSGSAWRAAWMLVLVFATRLFQRHPNPIRIVALTVVVGVLVDPLVVFDVSFMLSLAATAGLLTLGRAWMNRLKGVRSVILRYVALSMAATVASMVPCVPLLAGLSPNLTLAGLFANVVAAPVGELFALPVCLMHAISSALPLLERGLALVGSGSLLAVRWVAHQSAAQQALAFAVPAPESWHLAIVAVAAVGCLCAVGLRPRAYLMAWLAGGALGVVGFERSQAPRAGPGEKLVVSMLDVGQGDATLLEFPSGDAMLVDGGGFVGSGVDPGQRVLLPVLRARRRTRLAVVALSHPHPDHFTGLSSLAKSVDIDEFWDTGQGEALGAGPVYRELLRTLREKGTTIRRPRDLCGPPRRFGEVVVHVVAPCPAFVRERSANDNSLVLRVSFSERTFLLTGDAEAAQERSLRGQPLLADVLKVGHHGSRTSTSPEFLARVRPTFATISSGLRNGFGHPHPETLSTLGAAGVGLLRLDRMGGVSFTTDGRALDVHAFSPAY